MDSSIKYIQDASKLIDRTISSGDLDKKVKSDVIKEFIRVMTENPFSNEAMADSCEDHYYGFMLRYMDKELADLLDQEYINQVLYDKACKLVDVQRANIVYIRAHKMDMGKLKNPDLDDYLGAVLTKYNNTTLIENTKAKEKEVFENYKAKDTFSAEGFKCFFALVSEYETLISKCRENKINCSKFQYSKVNEFKLDVQEFQRKFAKRQELYSEMYRLDQEIALSDQSSEFNIEILDKLISNCYALNELKMKCTKKNWDLPNLQCSSPENYINKYQLYKKMIEVDKIIAPLANVEDISKLRTLRKMCLLQKTNIQTCNGNGWKIPQLTVNHVDQLFTRSNSIVNSADRRRREKLTVAIVLVSIVLIVSTSVISYIHYHNTHTKIEYSLDELIGMDYKKVKREFQQAGFENVRVKEVDDGYLPAGQVFSVTINSNPDVVAGRSYRIDADVVIKYSSSNRTDITGFVDSWESQNYRNLEYTLEFNQFDVDIEEVFNDDLSNNGGIYSLTINGVPYDSGECWVPSGCDIDMVVYALAIQIDDDPDDFIGRDYEDVLDDLEDMGFDNIVFERKDDLITGILTPDGSIDSITINNSSSFDEDDVFCHDAEIVIVVHTFSGRDYRYLPD